MQTAEPDVGNKSASDYLSCFCFEGLLQDAIALSLMISSSGIGPYDQILNPYAGTISAVNHFAVLDSFKILLLDLF